MNRDDKDDTHRCLWCNWRIDSVQVATAGGVCVTCASPLGRKSALLLRVCDAVDELIVAWNANRNLGPTVTRLTSLREVIREEFESIALTR